MVVLCHFTITTLLHYSIIYNEVAQQRLASWAELGALAERHGLPLHVDACYGGFVLPWLERNGASLPAWDFRVLQVTSISADFHKYGFAEKGASAVLFRDAALRQHMYYSYSRWPGGIYVSPSMAGTRPGGAVACAGRN